mgnify:CR=1 FL=1
MLKAVEFVRPVVGIPAGIIDRLKLVVIADLHIGYESELAKEGIYLPKSQIHRLKDRVLKLRRNVPYDRLLINGDLKHSFSRLSKQERAEVSEFLELVLGLFKEVILVRGNHDNYLPIIARRHGIELLNEYSENGVLFIHGHADPGVNKLSNYDVVVIGHEHPSVVVRDAIGYPYKFPVMLYIPTNYEFEMVVLPFFSTITTGNVVTVDRSTILSPIIKNYGRLEEAVSLVAKFASKWRIDVSLALQEVRDALEEANQNLAQTSTLALQAASSTSSLASLAQFSLDFSLISSGMDLL